MNELKIFEHPKFGKIRTIVEDGKTLFCGKDAATALGYAKPQNAIATHCKGALKRSVPTNGGIQEMLFITEGDLCRLAAKSELPGANEFESWIFDEVIPAILRTGTYSVAPATPHKPVEVSPGGMAKLILVNRRVMLDMGCSFVEVGAATKVLYEVYGIPVPIAFTGQIPGQLCLFDRPALEKDEKRPVRCSQHLTGHREPKPIKISLYLHYSRRGRGKQGGKHER